MASNKRRVLGEVENNVLGGNRVKQRFNGDLKVRKEDKENVPQGLYSPPNKRACIDDWDFLKSCDFYIDNTCRSSDIGRIRKWLRKAGALEHLFFSDRVTLVVSNREYIRHRKYPEHDMFHLMNGITKRVWSYSAVVTLLKKHIQPPQKQVFSLSTALKSDEQPKDLASFKENYMFVYHISGKYKAVAFKEWENINDVPQIRPHCKGRCLFLKDDFSAQAIKRWKKYEEDNADRLLIRREKLKSVFEHPNTEEQVNCSDRLQPFHEEKPQVLDFGVSIDGSMMTGKLSTNLREMVGDSFQNDNYLKRNRALKRRMVEEEVIVKRQKAAKKTVTKAKLVKCENCRVNFSVLEKHLKSQEHREFVLNSKNFTQIDEFIKELRAS